MTQDGKSDEQYHEDRAAALAAILESSAPKKVVIAGPGCGKTHTFGEVLKRSAGTNLVLTFINNLAGDLADDLGGYADVYTFHKFSRILLHSLHVADVTHDVDYYPPLRRIFVEDIFAIHDVDLTPMEVDNSFHTLDNSISTVERVLRSGAYYNAVSHTDAVYRVLRHLGTHPEDVPQYSQIVVDEYQDFSLLEVRFIDILAGRSRTLVAGDDDQALYDFKQASPEFLREIAGSKEWEAFELPFCSRCPPALVEATHRIVRAARQNDRLAGRLEKAFVCFLPAKRDEAERYPNITHARCTVQRNNAPYMAQYVAEEIGKISGDDVTASKEAGNPTVLVIGPNPFLGQVGAYLAASFSHVDVRQGADAEVDPLHGYIRLMKDEASRLGWRILMYVDPPLTADEILTRCIPEERELRDELPPTYVERHLQIVELLRTLANGSALPERDQKVVEAATGVALDGLLVELGVVEVDDDAQTASADPNSPTIVCTTLVGAKGLQAEHVFIVGASETHIPRVPGQPTDVEVCQFLVALTRAKRSCTIVTCNRLGNQQLQPSVLIDALGDLVSTKTINRKYFLK